MKKKFLRTLIFCRKSGRKCIKYVHFPRSSYFQKSVWDVGETWFNGNIDIKSDFSNALKWQIMACDLCQRKSPET